MQACLSVALFAAAPTRNEYNDCKIVVRIDQSLT